MDKQPIPMVPVEGISEQVPIRHIQLCEPHNKQLVQRLTDLKLDHMMAKTDEELQERLEAGQLDVLLESSATLTSSALQCFGFQGIANVNGCAVCAFQNIIPFIADAMVTKYTKLN